MACSNEITNPDNSMVPKEIFLLCGLGCLTIFILEFSSLKNLSSDYGKHLYACFLNVHAPFKITPMGGWNWANRGNNDEGGYYDNLPRNINWVVKNSSQIKLADGSNTTFDESNPDIRNAVKIVDGLFTHDLYKPEVKAAWGSIVAELAKQFIKVIR